MSKASVDLAAAHLASAPFERLWERARASLERSGGVLDGRRITIVDANREEAEAWSALIGKHFLAGKAITIRLDHLDEALQASRLGAGLVDWLTEQGGPIRNKPREREERENGEAKLWTVAKLAPFSADSGYLRWVDGLRADGLLKRLSPGSEMQLLRQALTLVSLMFEQGEGGELEPKEQVRSIARLAAEVTGDSKALDHGQPLSTVMLRLLAELAGRQLPQSSRERRELWEQFAVVLDPLSSRALVLNLRGVGSDPLARRLGEAAERHEPQSLTLREIERSELALATQDIFICENPSIILDACETLPSSRALLCVEGQPSVAISKLLARAVDAGCRLHYHGDFDWPGVRIAAGIMHRFAAKPWRFDAASYCEALASVQGAPDPLSGRPQATPWDPELAASMQEAGRIIYEEALVATLLEDLAA